MLVLIGLLLTSVIVAQPGQFQDQTSWNWPVAGQYFTGDFNGDGFDDVGSHDPDNEGNWYINYGSGNGQFSGQKQYKWVAGNTIFTGDFNGDGLTDIGTYNANNAGNWIIQYATKNGSFSGQTSWSWPVGGKIFTGDFNGDGLFDVGTYNANGQGNWYIQYATGKGKFSGQTSWNWPVGGQIFTGDFNGDGYWDVGTHDADNKGNWYINYGEGDGDFSGQTQYNWTAGNTIFTGDFNGDGITDVGTYNANNQKNWTIRYNAGNPLGLYDHDYIVPADFNMDGITDLAAYVAEQGNWFVQYSEPKKTVPFAKQTVHSWENAGQKFTGDFDGDGKIDRGTYNRSGKHEWYIEYGNKKIGLKSWQWNPAANCEVLTGDFNKDGHDDIGVYIPYSGSWIFKYSDPSETGTFTTGFTYKWHTPGHSFTGDFNGDGFWDIGKYNGQDWFIAYNNGDGSFNPQKPWPWSVGDNIFTGDFNGDKYWDIGAFDPNKEGNWYINYGSKAGNFNSLSQTVWAGGSPDSWNPCCSNGKFSLAKGMGSFLGQASSTSDLRKALCIADSLPTQAPVYTGNTLKAYKWLSNQAYPKSNGDIRAQYKYISLPWSDYRENIESSKSKLCNCGSKPEFLKVKKELLSELEAVQAVQKFFSVLQSNYINPLFITKTEIISEVVADFNLPNQTMVQVNTDAVINKTIDAFSLGVADVTLGEISPFAPIALSALMNLSRTENGGKVPDKVYAAVDQLETELPKAFNNVQNNVDRLLENILKDYSAYMKLSSRLKVTPIQLDTLRKKAAIQYKRQLYVAMIPPACRIVYYPSQDNLSQENKILYESKYSVPAPKIKQIQYMSSNYNVYSTDLQTLTSYTSRMRGSYSEGGTECVNNALNDILYTKIFKTYGFTYPEISALPGMNFIYQCGGSCNSFDDCRNQLCRPQDCAD